MNDEQAVKAALSPLLEGPEPEASPVDEERRARVVARLARLQRDVPRRRTQARLAIGGGITVLAAAAALVLAFRGEDAETGTRAGGPLWVEARAGRPTQETEGRVAEVAERRLVPRDGRSVVETPEGSEARLLGGAFEVTVRAGSRIELAGASVVDAPEELRLTRGAVECSVVPGGGRSKLAVVTPDARVVVKGTVFSVEVARDADGAARTCVRVSRGVVAVSNASGERDVRAGEDFGCAPLPPPQVEPELAKEAASAAPRGERVPVRPSGAPKASTLDAQNAAFARALAAERAGRVGDARRELERLLAAYPGTPLGPEVERALRRLEGVEGRRP